MVRAAKSMWPNNIIRMDVIDLSVSIMAITPCAVVVWDQMTDLNASHLVPSFHAAWGYNAISEDEVPDTLNEKPQTSVIVHVYYHIQKFQYIERTSMQFKFPIASLDKTKSENHDDVYFKALRREYWFINTNKHMNI